MIFENLWKFKCAYLLRRNWCSRQLCWLEKATALPFQLSKRTQNSTQYRSTTIIGRKTITWFCEFIYYGELVFYALWSLHTCCFCNNYLNLFKQFLFLEHNNKTKWITKFDICNWQMKCQRTLSIMNLVKLQETLRCIYISGK